MPERRMMPNHPNRSRRENPAANPKPEQIRELREQTGLTQQQMADLIHYNIRGYQKFEAGNTRMHPAVWELLQIKAGSSP